MNNDVELKKKLIDMLKWFHNFCVANNIRYYVLGGTMLGAVRHHGIIPWDDDIDVGVVSDDYLKLEGLFSHTKQTRYKFEGPSTEASDYYYSFSKLYDTSTTLIENTKYKIKRGVYIDIFPLVGMGNNEQESIARFNVINKQFFYLLARTAGIRRGRSWFKNITIQLLRIIPDSLSNDKKRLVKLHKFANERSFFDYKLGGNPFGAWRYKEIMETAIMGTPTLYQFEDFEVFGAEKYDEYLTHMYGNWRQLPPKEKQITHHDYIGLDLEKSYLSR